MNMMKAHYMHAMQSNEIRYFVKLIYDQKRDDKEETGDLW
jgi:hypothetical protein